MAPICPKCHQYISVTRLGVRMPPLKARILDAIKAAGDLGASSHELTFEVYRGYARQRSPAGIKSHVYQLNEMLAGTDWRIVADPPCGGTARWYLVRRPAMREAAE